MRTVLRHRIFGVVFIGLLALGVFATYAVFNKTFVNVTHVTLRSGRTGMQLSPHADVKARGVIVGEVRSVSSNGHGAVLDLALDPASVGELPSNVTARILPKTLFGEKYVALQIPANPSSVSLAAGDVIRESSVSIEVETVLADSYPLLTAVQPADLSYTLNALSTALEGRGTAIGDNLVRLNGYLKQLNPLMPSIIEDLRLLRKVSDIYRSVLPDLAKFLDNSVVTGHTVIDKQAQLQALFTDVTAMSSTTRDFLQANGDQIIRLGKVSLPTLQLLAKYAPEYPCLAAGLARQIPRSAETFRGYILHINLELLNNQPTGYSRRDNPVYGANTGPHCSGLPDPPYSQANPAPQPDVQDGVSGDHGKSRPAPSYDVTSGYAGTAAEQAVVDAIAAPVLGVPASRVPDVATLLLGPIARGTQVSLQ